MTRTSNFGGAGPLPANALARPRPVRHRRHGRQRQGVGVERHRQRQALPARRRVERAGLQFLYSDSRIAVRSIGDQRLSLHEGRRAAGAGGARRRHRAAVAQLRRREAGGRRGVSHLRGTVRATTGRRSSRASEKTDDATPHWRHEIVSIAAAYGGERLPIHLFLPKNVKPPFQTVLFFPGSGASGARASADLPARRLARIRLRPHERPGRGVSDLQVHVRTRRSDK